MQRELWSGEEVHRLARLIEKLSKDGHWPLAKDEKGDANFVVMVLPVLPESLGQRAEQ